MGGTAEAVVWAVYGHFGRAPMLSFETNNARRFTTGVTRVAPLQYVQPSPLLEYSTEGLSKAGYPVSIVKLEL